MSLFRKNFTPTPGRRRTQPGEVRPHATPAPSSEGFSFRRGQTLTGTVSAQVTSANERRGQLKSPRVQAHELRRQRKHLGLTLVGTIVAFGVVLFLLANFIAVPRVSVSTPHQAADSAAYEKIVDEYLSSRPVERSLLVLNRDNLLATIQEQRPEIKSIADISTNYMGTIDFTLTPRQPIAGWSIDGRQRYVDGDGVAFSRNYYDDPRVTIVDESGLSSDGRTVASNRFLGFIGRVVSAASAQGLTVTRVALPAGTTRQIAVSVEQVSFPTRMTVDRPAGEQVEDMARVIRHVGSTGQQLQYVDVRVSRRAFYRE